MKSYKILQKLSPKHAAHGVAQSTYPICRRGKACLSKQPPWRAAGDPRLARGRSRVRAPGPAGALRVLFFSTLPSFPLREISFFRTFPTNSAKVLGLTYVVLGGSYRQEDMLTDCSCFHTHEKPIFNWQLMHPLIPIVSTSRFLNPFIRMLGTNQGNG